MPRLNQIINPINLAGPVNRAAPLNRDLAHWWLCLPGLMGGEYLPDLMKLPSNRYQGSTHAQRSTSGADTYTNNPTWGLGTNRPGGFGHMVARNLTSPIGVLDCGDVMEADQTWDFTWLINVYVRALNSAFDTFLVQSGASSTRLALSIDNTTKAPQMEFPAGGGGTLVGSTAISAVSRRWLQIGVTWSSADSNRLSLYVNGRLDVTGTGFTGRVITSPVNNFNISGDAQTGRKFTGNFDDIRVWKRALTAFEMRTVYQDSLNGYPETLTRMKIPVVGFPSGVAIRDSNLFWYSKYGRPFLGA